MGTTPDFVVAKKSLSASDASTLVRTRPVDSVVLDAVLKQEPDI